MTISYKAGQGCLPLTNFMSDTSLGAFHRNKDKLSNREKEVYETLIRYCTNYVGLTDQEITKLLNQSDPNYVRPRRRELVKKGIVFDVGKRECTVTHETSTIWGLRV